MKTRTKQLTVRFTSAEYAALKKKAAEANTKMEPLVRDLVAGCKITVRDEESYRKLSYQLTGIERNINQIAHVANATGRVEADMILDVLEQMVEVRDMFQEMM